MNRAHRARPVPGAPSQPPGLREQSLGRARFPQGEHLGRSPHISEFWAQEAGARQVRWELGVSRPGPPRTGGRGDCWDWEAEADGSKPEQNRPDRVSVTLKITGRHLSRFPRKHAVRAAPGEGSVDAGSLLGVGLESGRGVRGSGQRGQL